VVGSCECGNETLGWIKCGDLFGLAENLLVSQEGLCYMELVNL
jgi:hypothetical protein